MTRLVSPLAASTVMTSAPRSPRIWVAIGPMTTDVRSRTRTPCSEPVPVVPVVMPGVSSIGVDERPFPFPTPLRHVVGEADGGEREDRRRQQRRPADDVHEGEGVDDRGPDGDGAVPDAVGGVGPQRDDAAGPHGGDDAADGVAGDRHAGGGSSGCSPRWVAYLRSNK